LGTGSFGYVFTLGMPAMPLIKVFSIVKCRGEKIRMAGILTIVVVADNRADRTSCGK
jgi:hypothetical protein